MTKSTAPCVRYFLFVGNLINMLSITKAVRNAASKGLRR